MTKHKEREGTASMDSAWEQLAAALNWPASNGVTISAQASPRAPKAKGGVVEAKFQWVGTARDYVVARPFCDNWCFDFLVGRAFNMCGASGMLKKSSTRRARRTHKGHKGKHRSTGIVISHARFYRAQIKAGSTPQGDGFVVPCYRPSTHKPYSPREVDFIVAYIRKTRSWYIVPIRALGKRLTFTVYPRSKGKKGLFEQYKGNWKQFGE